jgi:hypothetical protein
MIYKKLFIILSVCFLISGCNTMMEKTSWKGNFNYSHVIPVLGTTNNINTEILSWVFDDNKTTSLICKVTYMTTSGINTDVGDILYFKGTYDISTESNLSFTINWDKTVKANGTVNTYSATKNLIILNGGGNIDFINNKGTGSFSGNFDYTYSTVTYNIQITGTYGLEKNL